MESLFFHPRMVHLPLALGVLMPLIAGGIVLAWWRRWLPPRTWVLAVVLQGMLFGSGFVAMRSGAAEEDRVEAIVGGQAVHAHEEAAEAFVWTSAGVFALMLLSFVVSSRRAGLPLAVLGVVGAVVVLGLAVRTGGAGGRLVYERGAASAYVTSAGQSQTSSGQGAQETGDEDDH